MKYFYYGHMGSVYTSDDVLDYEDLYCDECGDSDQLIAEVRTFGDLLSAICLMKNFYCLDTEYIKEIIAGEYPDIDITIPTYGSLPQRDWEKTSREDNPVYCCQFNVGCESWYTMKDLEPDCSDCSLNFEYELYKLNSDAYHKDMIPAD